MRRVRQGTGYIETKVGSIFTAHARDVAYSSFLAMEGEGMAKQTRTPLERDSAPDITWRGAYSLEEREAMIREAAYYHFAKRGYAPGHDLDDWLAAEAEIERRTAGAPEFPSDIQVQQSSVHGARKDEELKRIVRQHPQKAIPQIESLEAEDAPFKE
jgi:hypothetical protein